jgi:hypothetical protein
MAFSLGSLKSSPWEQGRFSKFLGQIKNESYEGEKIFLNLAQ